MADTSGLPTRSRRRFLLGAGAVVVAACSDADGDAIPEPSSTTSGARGSEPDSSDAAATAAGGDAGDGAIETDLEALTPAAFDAVPICILTASAAAGPFPSRTQLDRRDVTEGSPGHPLRLGIRVVDKECRPVPDALVEIWHTDASGDYSDYVDGGSGKDDGQGTTFCRGFQAADANGITEFQTIYPGWYEGRAVHIHVRAHLDGDLILTAQLYFDDSYTESVHATGPYAQFGPPDTTWATDSLIGDPTTDGTGVVVAAADGPGSLGLVNLGIDLT